LTDNENLLSKVKRKRLYIYTSPSVFILKTAELMVLGKTIKCLPLRNTNP